MKSLDVPMTVIWGIIHLNAVWFGAFILMVAAVMASPDHPSDLSYAQIPLLCFILLGSAAGGVGFRRMSLSRELTVLPVSSVVAARRRGLLSLAYIAIPALPLAAGYSIWAALREAPSLHPAYLLHAGTGALMFLAGPVLGRLLEGIDLREAALRWFGLALAFNLLNLLLMELAGPTIQCSLLAAGALGLFVWGGPRHAASSGWLERLWPRGPERLQLTPAASPEHAHLAMALKSTLAACGVLLVVLSPLYSLHELPDFLKPMISESPLGPHIFLLYFALLMAGGLEHQPPVPLPVSTTFRMRVALVLRMLVLGGVLLLGHLVADLRYPLLPLVGLVVCFGVDSTLMTKALATVGRSHPLQVLRHPALLLTGMLLLSVTVPAPVLDLPAHWHPDSAALHRLESLPTLHAWHLLLLGAATCVTGGILVVRRHALRWAS